MDDKKLSEILHKLDVPQADENAKKRAVNLAMHEFRENQKKNEKNSQGFSLLSRLMGRQNKNSRRETMESKQKKKFIYGGMATAMAVVLIAGVSLTQMQNGIFDGRDDSLAQFSSVGTAPEMTVAPGTEEASPAYVEAVQDVNQQQIKAASEIEDPVQRWRQLNGQEPLEKEPMNEEMKQALSKQLESGNAQVPIPIDPPVGRLEISPKEKKDSRALSRTRQAPAEADMAMEEAEAQNFAGNVASDAAAPQPPVSTQAARKMAPETLIAPMPQPVPDVIQPRQYEGRDQFEAFDPNPIMQVAENPVSTFSVDVDTASYSFMRKQIEQGRMPAPNSIRVEELINYFDYDYPLPETREVPFRHNVSVTPSPWAEQKKLVHIGIKGYEMDGPKPKSNLVFLLDVSGSMSQQDKLPLLKNSLKLLLDTLNPDDTVAIAVYAGAAGTVLEPTKVSDKSTIINALDNLQAGGSTAGAAGIKLAYQLAQENFDDEAVNRVILATDGDFNVGMSNHEELKKYIEDKRESGVFLSVLGFGQGNYNDQLMQALAQNGNGVAAYIDSLSEARKVLVEEAGSSLFPIAKDVKIQIEFNPEMVSEYRLIGYETRALAREDFNNDKIDAGDIGAGHTVTAIYEITPKGATPSVDPLRYGDAEKVDECPPCPEGQAGTPPVTCAACPAEAESSDEFSGEYAFLKMRYKLPKENTSKLITTPVTDSNWGALEPIQCGPAEDCVQSVSNDVRFSTAVAAFGQKLQGGKYLNDYSYDDIIALAQEGKGGDEFGYRNEFINLVRLAKSLDQRD